MEHIDAVKAQVDPLANETNEMLEKIQNLTIDMITESSFVQLEKWKADMYKLIDEIYSTKTKEMEDLIGKNTEKFVEHQKQQLESVMGIQDQVKQLAEDGDATFELIQSLKNQLATVQTNLTSFEKDYLVINTKVLAQGLVTVSSNLNKLILKGSSLNQCGGGLGTMPVNTMNFFHTPESFLSAASLRERVKKAHK